jgi:hypothetical protein
MSDEPKHMTWEEIADALGHERHDCGYFEGTFACKIRHIQINTGAAKAAKD